MGRRAVVEEQIMIPVPRSALMVAAPPATVTQRNCLAVFGLTPADYLRLAGSAFPVKKEGKLRVAKFADVESYLTSGAVTRPPRSTTPKPSPVQLRPIDDDAELGDALRKLGFRPRR